MQLELFVNGNVPSHCNYCMQQLAGNVFHSKQTNRYFCDVFCAQDDLSAQQIRSEQLRKRMA